STTRVPRSRSGPTDDANAGPKNGIHHLRITAPGPKRSRWAATRRQLRGSIESSRPATGNFGRSASGSSWDSPGNNRSGYWRVNVTPITCAWAPSASPSSARYCARPPRQGASGPSTAMRMDAVRLRPPSAAVGVGRTGKSAGGSKACSPRARGDADEEPAVGEVAGSSRSAARPAPGSPRARRGPAEEPARLEMERHHLAAVPGERGGHAVRAVEAGQDQEVAAAARARHLAADRSLSARELVDPVDVAGRDARLELLLPLPGLVQELAEPVDVSEQQ